MSAALNEEILTHNPFCSKGVKALTHLGHHHHNNNQRRDLIDEEDFYARDLSTDIEEREPFGLGLLL